MTTVHTKVFLKGGGEELTSIPEVLLFKLAKNIQDNGKETLHMQDGRKLVITGFMIYSSEFLIDARIIVVEGKEHEPSVVH